MIFTVGHGARSLEELVAVLESGSVALVVDIRRFPGSRRHPHLSRTSLEEALPRAGVDYRFAGDALGGRRASAPGPPRHPAWREPGFRGYADWMETAVFREAFHALVQEAERAPLAIMCAETLWWQCHRRLVSDALVIRGVPVTHLLSPTSKQPHVLAPMARVVDGWPVYDVGCLPGV